ncbi:hypothetical protein CTEN210_13322 [Chaetoceros tenuissimus]|uniref:Reverse transcriptase Ty1/copia-type domain-containing protein n=1 Tax=Chaetoceros tenuissimus TaxID=426638 RepID=A0AAD3D2W5_9STRA|nr:hypothetical protein CTEN210_13322 [Chaetoceros tenuissimus]
MVLLFSFALRASWYSKYCHGRKVYNIRSGDRRFISRVKRQRGNGEIFYEPLPTEIDNHADTICFGKNFRPVYFTSQVCTVSPFLDLYDSRQDVPICTGVTAVDLNDGATILLEAGQGLYFGNEMDRSLINPNQLRAFGIPVCDDPTDQHRKLGIDLGKEHVPMTMKGSICGFVSRCPTDEELASCPKYQISDEHTWDPTSKIFISSLNVGWGEDGYIASEFTRNISQVKSITNDDVLFDNSHYFHEFDRALARSGLGPDQLSDRMVADVTSNKRHHGTDANLLSRKWGIGLKKARDTIAKTTQFNIRSALLPLTRRYRTDLPTVTAFEESKSDCGDSLQELCSQVGVPRELHRDNAPEMSGSETSFMKLCRSNKIISSYTEPHSPWQNKCENIIGVIMKKAKARRVRRRIPNKVWDYQIVWECQIYSRTCHNGKDTGLERLTGDTIDISEWLDFEFYDLVWFWDDRDDEAKPSVGRWLGVSHHVGSALCYYILTDKGEVISRTTVQHIPREEFVKPDVQEAVKSYHSSLDQFLGQDQYIYPQEDNEFIRDDVEADIGTGFSDEDLGMMLVALDVDAFVVADDAETESDTYDKYIGAEISLPNAADNKLMAKVRRKVKSNDLNEDANYNPILDNSIYEVQFSDGSTEEISANVIAENMLSQVDAEGHHFQILKEISDHKKNWNALSVSEGFHTRRGSTQKIPRKTTRGWDLLVEWKDGSMDWIKLSALKESYPVQLAEYAVANGIDHEPAFNWWVKKTLRRRDRIISKVKSKYWRTTHKFGIRIPKTVAEAYKIDQLTGTDFWTKAIEKEMSNVRIAFERLEGVTREEMETGKVKPGYKFCGTHMIFDIKMDGKFTRKARLVADGHKTDAPASITYSSVVSRDSVRICLMVASLNGLNVFACDIGNAYLNANCREKLWTVAGAEFGSEKDSVMIIARALYGLKSSGAAWRAKLAETMSEIGYFPSQADQDVWMKAANKADGTPYYKYMLVYVDDILHIAEDPTVDMALINSIYRLKEGVGPPDRYLGGTMEKVQIQDGSSAWSMNCVEYLKGAIENVDNQLQDHDSALKNYGDGKRPYPSSYRPEMDVTQELDAELMNRFQQYIGVLRWAIELGRIDVMTEVSCLSQHLASPREGHLNAVYKIFRYLQKNLSNNPGRLVFDGSYPETDPKMFVNSVTDSAEWNDFYPEAAEKFPAKKVEPLGNPVVVRAYVDANHAGNLKNRRSHSGILIYVNNAPIIWYSKRQNTVESSSFGSEYIALRICTEMVEALRYKLRCFGIPIDGPAEVYCDNQSVVTNSSVPSSVLNKRHNAICYHRVREAQAAGTIMVGWIKGEYNLADLFTKTTMTGELKHRLVHNIFNNDAAPLKVKT